MVYVRVWRLESTQLKSLRHVHRSMASELAEAVPGEATGLREPVYPSRVPSRRPTYISLLIIITSDLIMHQKLMIAELLREFASERIPAKKAKAGLRIGEGKYSQPFAVLEKDRAPRPSEVETLDVAKEDLARNGYPLLVARYVAKGAGITLTERGWSWADTCGNWDIRAPGLRLQRRIVSEPPATPNRPDLPGSGRGLALVRWLVHLPNDGVSATNLAAHAGVSQPRASQVLKRLVDLELVEHPSRFEWTVHRERVLERFLDDYRGPQATAQFYYSLKSPNEAAAELFASLGKMDGAFVSGDVAADLLAPHKSPERLLVYQMAPWKALPKGWVEAAGPEDSNITVANPRDDSVATVVLEREFKGQTIKLADPTQVLWDLQQAGGDDRLDAAEKLKTWILENQCAS